MTKHKSLKIICSFVMLFFISKQSFSFLPINLLNGFDPNLTPVKKPGERLQFTFNGATTFSITANNGLDQNVNPLQRSFQTQDALAMLKGFAPSTEQAQLGQLVNVNDDDGIRGHFKVTGDLKIPFFGTFLVHYYCNHGIWVGASLPILCAKVKNVQWKDLTQNFTLDDALTHQYITNDLENTVFRLGNGLKIGDWSNTGIGNIELRSGWRGYFAQEKTWLKQVMVSAWAGVVLPTDSRRNEDYAVSFDFGTGGAFAIPFGGDLALCFKNQFWLGVNLIFFQTFNHTSMRRIQTDINQTDLLLLQLAKVRRQFGFIQKYNLYFEPIIYKGFSLRFAYEHIKENETKIYVLSESFSNTIANSNFSLDERTINDFIIEAKFCFDKGPQGIIFGKMPTGGKRSFQVPLIGFQINLDF